MPDNKAADPDYCPNISKVGEKKPTVNVSNFLKLPIEKMGAELARSAAGSEDNARIMTAVSNILYNTVGIEGPRPVITRSMVETAIRKDGIERVVALSKLNMRGRYDKLHIILLLLALVVWIAAKSGEKLHKRFFLPKFIFLLGLFFDGKKSNIRKDKDRKVNNTTVDFYTIVLQPEKKYVGFCSTSGTGIN